MILKHGMVFYKGKFEPLEVEITDGRITAIDTSIKGEEFVDCTGKRIIPGLFDIHTHGCLGEDFSKSGTGEIQKMCEFYAKHGVTSIIATTMTNEDQQYHRAMGYIREVMTTQAKEKNSIQAHIEGINMEGPFFGPEKKGAHDPNYLRPISQELFDEYDELSGHAIRLVDLDPTLPGAMEFIHNNKDKHTISLAHTACTYEQAKEAANAGATHVTHMFNAMRPMLHREPGLVGAASEFHLDSEIICDGIHIHPAIIHLMFQAMGEQMILISDSINPTGLPDGNYVAGGLPIEVRDGKAFLKDQTLAGSTITLFQAVKLAIEFGVPLEEAILSATYRPAKSVGMEDKVGSIAVGRRADLILTDDKFSLSQVYLSGNPIL